MGRSLRVDKNADEGFKAAADVSDSEGKFVGLLREVVSLSVDVDRVFCGQNSGVSFSSLYLNNVITMSVLFCQIHWQRCEVFPVAEI